MKIERKNRKALRSGKIWLYVSCRFDLASSANGFRRAQFYDFWLSFDSWRDFSMHDECSTNRSCACSAHIGSVHFHHFPMFPICQTCWPRGTISKMRSSERTHPHCCVFAARAMPALPGTTLDGEAKSTGSQKVPQGQLDHH